MVQIDARCKEYDKEVEKAIRLIKHRKLFYWLPLVILSISILALAAKVSEIFAYFFILVVIYAVVGKYILGRLFKKHNQKVYEIFMSFYKPVPPLSSAQLIEDNKQFSIIINDCGANCLSCWLENGELNYITDAFSRLQSLELKNTALNTYINLTREDFGKLRIPVKDIDHYRDGVLSCRYGSGVCKLKFKDEKALDEFIPQKEFYFNATKKNGDF